MNILFFYPDKERAVSLSSLMIAFQRQGHRVMLLTLSEEGALHEDVKKHGVETFTRPGKKKNILYYWLHARMLARFTKQHQVDIVYSHIQQANFISCLAQPFSPSRFILCRHHSDCAYVDNNAKEKRMDRIINRLGKEFIVPSQKVLDQMRNVEGVKDKKIHLIRYAYDFNAYPAPGPASVQEIRKQYPAQLLLIKVARLIPEKRHLLLFKVMKELVKKGLDIQLIALGEGSERSNLERYIRENELQSHIFMPGYREDVMNYLAAADIVVHVSASEASSNLAKEAGLLSKPVILCSDTGDFDEYIRNGVNGILVEKNDPSGELIKILEHSYHHPAQTGLLGPALHDTVLELFSLDRLLPSYDELNRRHG